MTKLVSRRSRTSPSRVPVADEVIQVNIPGLPYAVDASHALLEPDEGPWDVPVHQDVSRLQIDAFVARIGGDDDLEFARGESAPHLFAIEVRVPT